MSAVLLPDVKAFLNIPHDKQDDELQVTVDRAEAILSRRVGPLAPVTVTDEVHTGPGPVVLRRYPVVSVAGAMSSGVTVTDLDLNTDAGVLYGTFTSVDRGTKVSYIAGRATLPDDLQAAVLELVEHLWKSQRGTAPSQLALQQPDDNLQAGSGFLLPYRVQSLIEPYLVPVVA